MGPLLLFGISKTSWTCNIHIFFALKFLMNDFFFFPLELIRILKEHVDIFPCLKLVQFFFSYRIRFVFLCDICTWFYFVCDTMHMAPYLFFLVTYWVNPIFCIATNTIYHAAYRIAQKLPSLRCVTPNYVFMQNAMSHISSHLCDTSCCPKVSIFAVCHI